MYVSTRGGEKLPASKAILKGMASDGGLFIPEVFPKLNISSVKGLSYQELSKVIFSLFLDDFTADEIDYAVNSAYNKANFNESYVGYKHYKGIIFAELYKGPTCAFKDMALTILPYFIEISKKKWGVKEKSLILVATSGDTGGAALSSFKKNGAFDTVVLYPNKGVSEIQEKQMLYYTDKRTKAFAIDGNFDDCQTFVKNIFASYPKDNGVILSSANSINIGRLIPQVVYYYYTYLKALNEGDILKDEKFNVCVPTGNFGDIFAGYIAKEMGLPIDKFICASNVNSVLADFFKTGVYDKRRKFIKSNSPAMDILISSNLERLIYLACGKNAERVKQLMRELSTDGKYTLNESEINYLKNFVGEYATEEQTLSSIKRAFDEFGYLIDPHTAVAYYCYNKLALSNKTLIISTASPYKFPSTVAKALNLNENKSEFQLIFDISTFTNTVVPNSIKKLEMSKKKTVVKTKKQIEDIVLYKNKNVTIKVPCTTANLGCAFDSSGLAFNIYNNFSFEENDKDVLVGFSGNKKDNLVLNSYKRFFEKTGEKYVPVKITMKKCEVPLARGLGSSATCIVAGVLAGNYMTNCKYSQSTLLKFMTEIEGHPDNVAPCYLGKFATAYTSNGEVFVNNFSVSAKLKFYAFIPNFSLSTEKARSVLPRVVDFKDAVHNVSRAVILKDAFSLGNLDMVKAVFDDKLHQPYRFKLIKDGEKLKQMLESKGFAVAISGAGPTILAISYEDFDKKVITFDETIWQVKKLKPDVKGAIYG